MDAYVLIPVRKVEKSLRIVQPKYILIRFGEILFRHDEIIRSIVNKATTNFQSGYIFVMARSVIYTITDRIEKC